MEPTTLFDEPLLWGLHVDGILFILVAFFLIGLFIYRRWRYKYLDWYCATIAGILLAPHVFIILVTWLSRKAR